MLIKKLFIYDTDGIRYRHRETKEFFELLRFQSEFYQFSFFYCSSLTFHNYEFAYATKRGSLLTSHFWCSAFCYLVAMKGFFFSRLSFNLFVLVYIGLFFIYFFNSHICISESNQSNHSRLNSQPLTFSTFNSSIQHTQHTSNVWMDLPDPIYDEWCFCIYKVNITPYIKRKSNHY